MTTNRVNDIDDAIISRCISVLTYDYPSEEVRDSMWRQYLEQFNISYSDILIAELVDKFKKISGRDIKNISRLTSRYIQGYNHPEAKLEHFIDCAMFRGVVDINN